MNIEKQLPEDFSKQLIPGSIKPAMKFFNAGSRDLWQIDPRRIRKIDGFNVRQDNDRHRAHIRGLADSMKLEGYYQHEPLAGYVATEDNQPVIYIFDGNCRLDAALLAIAEGAAIEKLPVVVSQDGVNMEDLTVALVRSNSGKPLTPFETAVVCKRLCRFGHEPKAVAQRLGLTERYVDDLLVLISAPQQVRQMVVDERLAAYVAIAAIRKYGEGAYGKLLQAERAAAEAGKGRATNRFVPGAIYKKEVRKQAADIATALADVLSDPSFGDLQEALRARLADLLIKLETAKVRAGLGEPDLAASELKVA